MVDHILTLLTGGDSCCIRKRECKKQQFSNSQQKLTTSTDHWSGKDPARPLQIIVPRSNPSQIFYHLKLHLPPVLQAFRSWPGNQDLMWAVDAPDNTTDNSKLPQKLHNSAKAAKEQHLLLIDSDDQIVYSGPSTGMPLFARLGLLHTVEVSESEKNVASFVSHTASALGITSASTSSGDFFNICLQHCPQALMFNLIGYHLKTRQF